MKRKKKRINKGDQRLKRMSNGYVQVRVGERWMFEHRLVCENFINRELTGSESVHHIDGDKKNNLISNLMIFKNHEKHKNFEKYIEKNGFNKQVKLIVEKRWERYL